MHCLTHRPPTNDGQHNQLKVEKIKQTIIVDPATGQTGISYRTIETRPSTWASSAPKARDILLKLKERSFNQALIDTTISTDYFSFQNEASHSQRIRKFLANTSYQATVSMANILDFSKELADIYYYEKVSKHTDIEADTNKTTYLLLTEHSMQDTSSPGLVGGLGWPTEAVCNAGNHKCSVTFGETFKGGNFTVVFETKYPNIHHLVHELGHSFSLPHTFLEVGDTPFQGVHYFYRGYTDNIMDYSKKKPPPSPKATAPGAVIPALTPAALLNLHTLNATYKWQWDILRKDNTLI